MGRPVPAFLVAVYLKKPPFSTLASYSAGTYDTISLKYFVLGRHLMSFVIITDSSCDLPSDLRKQFGIAAVLPGTVTFPDGTTQYGDMDWNNISPQEFYDSMSVGKKIYTTSLPNMEEVKSVWLPFLEEGKDILCFNLSSGLSGTYSACVKTAEELKADFPDRTIICIDSLRYAGAVSLLAIYAAKMRDAGWSLGDTAAWCEEHKHCIHQMGPLDDLMFLSRVGRISSAKAISGTLIGIRPMADFSRTGKSQVLAKTRGMKKALRATINYMKANVVDPEKQIMFVMHTGKPAEAEQLRQMVEDTFHPAELYLLPIGQCCGSSIGPGLVAAYYYGTPLSEDLAEETQVLTQAIAEA